MTSDIKGNQQSTKPMSSGALLEALYEYRADVLDGKVLNIGKGEIFILIKSTKPDEWLYVANIEGRLGYIPANFVHMKNLSSPERLAILDKTLEALSHASATDIITVRQLNHARVKLSQVRCELARSLERVSVSTLDDAPSDIILEESSEQTQEEEQKDASTTTDKSELSINHEATFVPEAEQQTSDHEVSQTLSNDESSARKAEQKSKTNPEAEHSITENKVEAVKEHIKEQVKEQEMGAPYHVHHNHHHPPKEESEKKEMPAVVSSSLPSPPKEFRGDKNENLQKEERSTSKDKKEKEVIVNEKPDETERRYLLDNFDQIEEGVSQAKVCQLIEKVRVSSEQSHEKCKITVHAVLEFLGDSFPRWKPTCRLMLKMMDESIDEKSNIPEFIHSSSDSEKLKAIFQRLWSCKNDEQQRSWPVQEDEQQILQTLKDLTRLLKDANPVLTKDVLRRNNLDNVHMLTTYFQMESRRLLRMELLNILTQVIKLLDGIIPEYFLTSVLPSSLAEEMLTHTQDHERWKKAAILFTLVFSTGHEPPVTIYDHLDKRFICQLLDLIESESNIHPEDSIPPLLAFNLHFKSRKENLVIRALDERPIARHLTENLVSHLNWEEDPTRNSFVEFETGRPNAVHKLLLEIFESSHTSKLFYFNDIRVIIDIIMSHLNNMGADDQERLDCLSLTKQIVKNTSYKEEPHKQSELLKCLQDILAGENTSSDERRIADRVIKLLAK